MNNNSLVRLATESHREKHAGIGWCTPKQTIGDIKLEASRLEIQGRSKMNRNELVVAIDEHQELFDAVIADC